MILIMMILRVVSVAVVGRGCQVLLSSCHDPVVIVITVIATLGFAVLPFVKMHGQHF